jgi:hypothetical protein
LVGKIFSTTIDRAGRSNFRIWRKQISAINPRLIPRAKIAIKFQIPDEWSRLPYKAGKIFGFAESII